MKVSADGQRCHRAVVLKPWPARPSGVAREAIFIGKET